MLEVIILSALAGAIGTGLGGLLGVLFGGSEKRLSVLFSFAAGTMLGIVFFDLIPEAVRLTNVLVVILGIAIGMLFVFILNSQFDRKLNISQDIIVVGTKKNKFVLTGLLIFASITLHNFPEGLVIGTGGFIDASILTALLIAMHDIPEGMAMAVPMVAGGMKKSKAVFLCVISGLPTVLGGIIGYLIGNISPYFVSIAIGIASGAMMCIVFSEMLPMANKLNSDTRNSTVAVIVGALLALIMISFL